MSAAVACRWSLLILLALGWLGVRCWGAEAAAPGDASDALARAIVGKAGISIGVCELPRIGDGVLAAALARQGIAQVHGLAPDARAAEVARAPSASCGVLGSQVIIEPGSPASIPLGDWVADLLVVADASDANLQEIPPAEVRRVLAPYRGRAVVGQPQGAKGASKDAKGALSKKALLAWAEKTGGTTTVSDDASGLWVVVRMPALEGGDDWSHLMHAADGNLVSDDTAFGAGPYELQWTNKPYMAGHWDIHVISAGRMFSAQSSVFQRGDLPFELVTRSVYNGQVLWRRPIAADFGESESLIIARPERLYLKDKNRVLMLDPENGKELGSVTAYPDETLQCLLLLESDGVLLTLTGPVQKYGGEAESFDAPVRLKAQDDSNALYEGHELIAWDALTGKERWRFSADQIDPSKLVARDGHVYLYAARTYAACLDLRTGKQVWKTDAPIAEPKGPGLGFFAPHATVKGLSMERNGAMAIKDVYVINYPPHRHCQAFATADGHLLWDRMRGPEGTDPQKANEVAGWKMFSSPLIIGKAIFERENSQHPSSVWDAVSGEPIKDPMKFNTGGCGRFTGLASGLLIGQNGEVSDINTKGRVLDYGAKAGCGTGQFVADGLLMKVASRCGACYEWRGFFASRSVPKHDPRGGARLEQGKAPAPTAASLASDAADWTTYRSDNTRKSSSTATVAESGTIHWTYTPHSRPFSLGAGSEYLQPDQSPTQPIAVGDRVWFGTADGAVMCLDRKTGHELWCYWTAGRMWSPPSWSQGRIYAGSCDGWVHCLEAATGALVWRYRVAPEERRVMVLGRLSSAWPIMGNVVVQDGVVYALGGLIGQIGGSQLCALDAKTGTPRWEKHFDISATGQLAWYEGRLWLHAGDRGLFIVDPATGDVKPAAPTPGVWVDWSGQRGQDIGIMPGGWVVYGGRQFILPIDQANQYGSVCKFLRADADGPPHKDAQGALWVGLTMLDLAHCFDLLPVWDADEVLLFGKRAGYIPGGATMAPKPVPAVFCRNLGASLRTEAEARFAAAARPGAPAYKPEWVTAQPAAEQVRKALPDGYGNGETRTMNAVLGKNAVVLFYTNIVYAVDRAEARELWRIDLNGWGLPNGMSLTRAGDVLVAMTDGRVVCIGPEVEMPARDAVAIPDAKPGLAGACFLEPPGRNHLPAVGELDRHAPDATSVVAVVPTVGLAPANRPENFCLRLRGYITVPKAGKWRFSLTSDDGSRLLLHDEALIDNDGSHGMQTRIAAAVLAAGLHPLAIDYFQGDGGSGLRLEWEGPGQPRQEVPAAALSHRE